MNFSSQKEYSFYPDVYDNLKLPEEKRIKVFIDRPNQEQMEKLTKVEVIQDFTKNKKNKIMKMELIDRIGLILKNHVTKIENLSIDNKPVTTGEELAKSSAKGLKVLTDSIIEEVMNDDIGADDLKN